MVERVVTSGVFSFDGGEWEVSNDVWLVGDEEEVLVVDAAHDAAPIAAAIGGRRVVAIVLTPGGCCLHDEAAGLVFSGDTLFRGGPRITNGLPPGTVVHPGHGESTSIGDGAPHLGKRIGGGD